MSRDRKLASIQRISEIHPIPNADAIEVVRVLGWVVVVKKGEYKVGDKVVYCEIDSVLPDKPEFEFLRERDFRIKTMKLRGQFSQGICFSLDVLPSGIYEMGQDVTEILGIEKYEPPMPDGLGDAKGSFPYFIPKTDETRVQVIQEILTRYKGTKCYISEKLEGTSTTYFVRDGEFGVCSRNLELKDMPNSALWNIAREKEIERKLKELKMDISIQGETIGTGIQGNIYNLSKKEFFMFNAFDIKNQEYFSYEELVSLSNNLDVKLVPILDTNYILDDNIDDLVALSIGYSVLNKKIRREGIIIRPLEEITDINFGRISFKVINPDYLAKSKL